MSSVHVTVTTVSENAMKRSGALVILPTAKSQKNILFLQSAPLKVLKQPCRQLKCFEGSGERNTLHGPPATAEE